MAVGGSNAALADVVFGNLGASGTGAIDTGDTAIVGSSVSGSSGNSFAVAFRTGTNSSFLKLQSVTLGLSDVAPFSTALLAVVENNAGLPTGTQKASASLQVGSTGRYSFGLGNVAVSPNTTYWVTVTAQNATDPNQFNWLRAAAGDPFSGLNNSGYVVPSATYVRRSQDGGAWNNFTNGQTLSMSITAVPEPSTYALAAIGFGVAGFARWRRRASRSGR